MTYEKNPNYHRADEVTIEKQEFMLSSDENATFAAYNAGNLDFSDGVPTAEIAGVKESSEFYVVDTLGVTYVSFNVTSDLFDGMTAAEANTFRRALALLVDRDYIVTSITQTGQVPADSFIPYGCLDGNGEEFKNTSYYRQIRPTLRRMSKGYRDARIHWLSSMAACSPLKPRSTSSTL